MKPGMAVIPLASTILTFPPPVTPPAATETIFPPRTTIDPRSMTPALGVMIRAFVTIRSCAESDAHPAPIMAILSFIIEESSSSLRMISSRELMRLRSISALFVLALPGLAQLPAPNKTGISAGHDVLRAKDVEAANKFWQALGGEPVQFAG